VKFWILFEHFGAVIWQLGSNEVTCDSNRDGESPIAMVEKRRVCFFIWPSDRQQPNKFPSNFAR